MNDKVAIIGMSFNFPCGNGKEALHSLLLDGKVAKTREETLKKRTMLSNVEEFPDLIKSVRLIDGIELFDPKFFGIVKREALEMSPEMRLMMTHAAGALYDAGYTMDDTLKWNCGAVTTQSAIMYNMLIKRPSFLSNFNHMEALSGGYLAHYFNLTGPVYHIDSTCSSSLLAVVEAYNMLVSNQTDYMLVGGAQLFMPLNKRDSKAIFSSALGLSADESCIPFDKKASGFFSGEGAGMILLKRLNDAKRDNDNIYGVISGYGMSSNGNLSNTVYAPNGDMQSKALGSAIRMSKHTLEDFTEFEAHGAATEQGDFAEIFSIGKNFKKRNSNKKMLIGSVKSNIGHTVHMAGLAGLIKVLLGFDKNVFYPIAGYSEHKEELCFDEVNLEPSQRIYSFKEEEDRVADIGSYGLNELNVHLVVENYKYNSDSSLRVKNRIKPDFNYIEVWPSF